MQQTTTRSHQAAQAMRLFLETRRGNEQARHLTSLKQQDKQADRWCKMRRRLGQPVEYNALAVHLNHPVAPTRWESLLEYARGFTTLWLIADERRGIR